MTQKELLGETWIDYALVFYCYHDKQFQTQWFKTTQIYYLIGLEVRNPKWASLG